jgi:hypothetical protein
MMVPVSPSRVVRAGLEARFSALWNDALVKACEEFGIPELAFAINFDGLPEMNLSNYFRQERTLDTIEGKVDLDLPALAMWVGDAQDLSFEKARTFSGTVGAYWRFWLFGEMNESRLVELREAVEAAMIMVLDPEFTAFGFGYRGDLSWRQLGEQEVFGQDEAHFGWRQEVNFAANFEVNL